MIRDNRTNALLQTDVVELKKYRNEKQKYQEIAKIKSDVEHIKTVLHKLVSAIEDKNVGSNK